MKQLENELRSALRRQEPPPDFADKVLAQIAAAPAAKPGWRQVLRQLLSTPRLRWVAVGALACLLVAFGAFRYREVQRTRAQGEAAKVQLMQALRIASNKLNMARRKVQEIDRRDPQS
jgi:hypothetical protein